MSCATFRFFKDPFLYQTVQTAKREKGFHPCDVFSPFCLIIAPARNLEAIHNTCDSAPYKSPHGVQWMDAQHRSKFIFSCLSLFSLYGLYS